MIKWIRENLQLFAIASFTLGLAPFAPPHIWGKIQWLMGGGAFHGKKPMQAADWGDLLMHGAPWVLLILSLLLNASNNLSNKN